MIPAFQTDLSPFYLNSGSVGVLLIHGFTGAPPEMRLIGDYLHRRQMTVSAPMLPGHGTYVEDMNRYQWTDWVDHARQAMAKLKSDCDTVFIAGLSLGSLIALHLAAEDQDLPGAILYSPSIKLTSRLIYLTPILKYFVEKVKKPPEKYEVQAAERQNWTYNERPLAAVHELLKIVRHTRTLLPKVKCPLLFVQGARDEVIDPACSHIIYNHSGSKDKEVLTLDKSGHCLTIENQWESAAEKTHRFIVNHMDTR